MSKRGFIETIKRIFKLEEQINNIIRYGVIKEVVNNKVVVSFGDNLESPLLPYIINGSGNARVYFLPRSGDQVMIISSGGNINNAVVLPCIYRDSENEAIDDSWSLLFSKGSIIYKEGKLEIKAESEVNIVSPKANITSDQIILGDDSGGEVVCKMHTCSFTGAPHSMGSSKIKGAM